MEFSVHTRVRSRRWWSGFEVSRSNCPGGGQSSRSLQLSRPRAHGSILAPHAAFMRRMSAYVNPRYRRSRGAMSGARSQAMCLMSYGTSLADGWRLAGVYASKILRGAKPADFADSKRRESRTGHQYEDRAKAPHRPAATARPCGRGVIEWGRQTRA